MFYWAAFIDLLSTIKYEGGPIPWDSILIYAQYYRLDPNELEDFAAIIRRLDNTLGELRKSK
jgi:hypothetical protein